MSVVIANGAFIVSNFTTVSPSLSSCSSSSAGGQGSPSAKVIQALGDLVIRGSDRLVIQRRLASINSQVANQTSGQESVLAYGKYSLSPYPISSASLFGLSTSKWGEILELSRRDLYPDYIRQSALNRIMMQLETGDLRPLIEVLAKWQYVELQIFLFELMACLPDERLNAFTSQRSHVVESIRAEYSASSTIRKEQITRAFIRAMKLLLQAGQLAAEAAIDAGLLTVILLVVAAEGFNLPLQRRNSGVSLTLRESKEALMVLALYEDPDFRLGLACWPFMLFWPQAEDFSLPECFMARLEPAQVRPGSSTLLSDAWRLRLGAINALMSVRQFTRSHVEYVRSALTELVWLLCHSELDSSLQILSSSMLLKFVALGPKMWKIIGELLADCSFQNVVSVLHILASTFQNTTSTRSLADFRHCLPKRKASKPVDYFLEFITFISREFPVLAKPLCESRIASLLLSVLSDIDPTMTYPSWTPSSNVVPRDQLLRNTLSKLSTVRQRPDEFLRILDIGVTISVSLLMIEDSSTSCILGADDINELWKSATMDRLRPILSSALRQIWMLMAFQKNTVINKQTDLTRLLICFQALAMVSNVNVYSTPSSSVES